MMPETKAAAKRHAKKVGIPQSQLVKGKKGWYIAPSGVKSRAAKKAYASRRDRGQSKTRSAKQAWFVEHRARGD
jgi:hypothetical protein